MTRLLLIHAPPPPISQVRPLNVDGSLNLLGLETVRLIYFRNKMAGKNFPAGHWKRRRQDVNNNKSQISVNEVINPTSLFISALSPSLVNFPGLLKLGFDGTSVLKRRRSSCSFLTRWSGVAALCCSPCKHA